MNIARTTAFCFFLAAAAGLNAQNNVRGQVVDGETLEGEPFATYSLSVKDAPAPLKTTITREDGTFSEPLPGNGTYLIRFSSLGRKDVEREFTVDGADVDLGRILMENGGETLSSASVTALKPLVKMEVDKMTYRMEDDVDSQSMTMLDMLRKVPMVTVDAQDKILVNGSSSFKVYVDGKPNAMLSSNPSQIFKMMPASAFKSVEVITNPGAKYDAEGVGGVLNLITDASLGRKAVQDGYNASLTFSADTRLDVGGGVFLSGQKGKVSFSADVNLVRQQLSGITYESSRQEVDAAGNVLSDLFSDAAASQRAPAVFGDITVGYEIDSLRLVSLTADVMDVSLGQDQTGRFSLTSGGGTFSYGSDVSSHNRFGSYKVGIDYQRSFAGKPGRALTASYLLVASPERNDSDNLFHALSAGAVPPGRRSLSGMRMTEQTVQVDFTTPVREGETLSAGVKYISRANASDSEYYLSDGGTSWVKDEAGSLVYRHRNDIVGVYGEFAVAREKWSGKAGLRYEHTFQDVTYKSGDGEDFRLDYGNFVPSASVQYNLGASSNVGLSYNLRISRPGIDYLNPYVNRTDLTALTYGNSALETEKSHNVNLVYNFFNPVVMLNLTARYGYTGNKVSAYSFFDGDGLLNTTYGNIVREQVTGLSAFVNVNIGQKTRLYSNLGADYADFVSEARGLSNHGWQLSAYTGVQQTLPRDLRLSVNWICNSRSYRLEGWTGGLSALIGGLTKSFFDERLTVGLTGLTGFGKGGNVSVRQYAAGKDYVSDTKVTIPLSYAGINVSYRFGTLRNVNVRKTSRPISNDDVLEKASDTPGAATSLPGAR